MSKAGRVSSAGNVVGIVRNLIDERASKTVGRIRMLHEGAMEGAAFDLPEVVALEVLAKKHELEVRPAAHVPLSEYLPHRACLRGISWDASSCAAWLNPSHN